MRLFFRTKAEKEADEKRRREAAQWQRELADLDREAEYYGQIIPEMLAQMGIDHQIAISRQPTLAAELILGQRTRQIVQFLEIHPTPDAIYFWIDTRRLPYLSMLMHMYKAEVLETLSIQCDHQILYRATPGQGAWFILVRSGSINAIPKLFPFEKALAMIPESAGPLAFVVGVGENGSVITADLAAKNSNNYLIGGAANSGKSVHMNSIICQLLKRNPTPRTLEFIMYDLKGGVELDFYSGIPHLRWDMISSTSKVVESLLKVQQLIDDRLLRLRLGHVKNIERWNLRNPDRLMPYIVLVFDELAAVLASFDKKMSADAGLVLGDILSRGRAAGIHAILCAQRPSAQIITPWVKTNCSLRICFAVPSNQDSMILMDNGAAARLECAGRAIYSHGRIFVELQSPFIDDDEGEVDKVVQEICGVPQTPSQEEETPPLQRLLNEAVDNLDGSLAWRPLSQAFKDDIPQHEIKRLLAELNENDTPTIRGTRYRVVNKGRGHGKGRWLEPIQDQLPTLPHIGRKIPHKLLKGQGQGYGILFHS